MHNLKKNNMLILDQSNVDDESTNKLNLKNSSDSKINHYSKNFLFPRSKGIVIPIPFTFNRKV